jgi:hypothetical protein
MREARVSFEEQSKSNLLHWLLWLPHCLHCSAVGLFFAASSKTQQELHFHYDL